MYDGEILVNGKDVLNNFDYGGGSGGSVFIEVEYFDGFGIIEVNGGVGGINGGGGGSGGRIVIYYN